MAIDGLETLLVLSLNWKTRMLTCARLAVLQLGPPIFQCGDGNDRLVEMGPTEIQTETRDFWFGRWSW